MGVCGSRHVLCRGGFVWRGYGRLGALVPWILETCCVGAFLLHVSADLCPFRSDFDGYVCVYVVVSKRMHPRWVGQHDFPGTSLLLFFHLFGSFVSMVWWTSSGTCPFDLRTSYDAFQVRLFAFWFACSSRVCTCFGFPREPTNATVRISFPFSFFFSRGSYRVRTVSLPCPPSRKFRLFFRFVSLFGGGRQRGNRKGKEGGRAEGHHLEEKEPREQPVISSSHVVVRVVRFLRSFVVERFHVFTPTLFHVHQAESTVVALEGDRRKTSCASLRAADPNSIVTSLLTIPSNQRGRRFSSRNSPNRMERSSERTETKARRMRRTKERKDSKRNACVAVRTRRDRCTRRRVGRSGNERIQTMRDARDGSTSSSSQKKKKKKTGSWSVHDRVVTRFVVDRTWVCVSRLVDFFPARFLSVDPLVFRWERVRPRVIFRFAWCDPVSSACVDGWFRSTHFWKPPRSTNETKRNETKEEEHCVPFHVASIHIRPSRRARSILRLLFRVSFCVCSSVSMLRIPQERSPSICHPWYVLLVSIPSPPRSSIAARNHHNTHPFLS